MNLGSESEFVEFKKSTGEHKEALQAISAMLNKHGRGDLYFGVRDNGDVVGQMVSDSTVKQIRSWISDKIEPAIHPVIEKISDEKGHDYVHVSFEGLRAPYSADGRYFIRVGTSDEILGSADLKEMAARFYEIDNPWDSRSSNKTVSDIPPNVIEQYVSMGNKSGRIPDLCADASSAVERLGLLSGSRLKNGAAELFCSSFPRTRLTMGVLASESKVDILDLKHEDGPAFGLIDLAERYAFSNVRRKLVIRGEAAREEIPEIPREAIREAIANAFCHRDYNHGSAVELNIFPDTVEIVNPGLFPEGDSPENHIEGKVGAVSDPRNPLIANLLFRAGIIEQYGSGIPRIKRSCDAANVKFEYRQEKGFTRIIFYRPGSQLHSGKTSDGSPHGAPSDFAMLIFEKMKEDGVMTTKQVMSYFGTKERRSQRALKELGDAGLATSHREGSKVVWRPLLKD